MRKCGPWDFSATTTKKKISSMKETETKSSEIVRTIK